MAVFSHSLNDTDSSLHQFNIFGGEVFRRIYTIIQKGKFKYILIRVEAGTYFSA